MRADGIAAAGIQQGLTTPFCPHPTAALSNPLHGTEAMQTLTQFERYMLSLPIPALRLPELKNPTDVDLWERAWIIGYSCYVPRGDENLRLLAMTSGILPASEDEVRELELAGY